MGRKRQTLALPPDPENMNDQRSDAALNAIASFGYATGECFEQFKGDDRLSILEQNISDFIADLAHACDRQEISLESMIERARNHYHEETDGEGGQL